MLLLLLCFNILIKVLVDYLPGSRCCSSNRVQQKEPEHLPLKDSGAVSLWQGGSSMHEYTGSALCLHLEVSMGSSCNPALPSAKRPSSTSHPPLAPTCRGLPGLPGSPTWPCVCQPLLKGSPKGTAWSRQGATLSEAGAPVSGQTRPHCTYTAQYFLCSREEPNAELLTVLWDLYQPHQADHERTVLINFISDLCRLASQIKAILFVIFL